MRFSSEVAAYKRGMDTETAANVSFSGCGFIGIYHVGVSACLKRHAPHLLQNKVGGSSAGAMAAVALVCDLSMVDVARSVAMLAHTVNQKFMGPFNPAFNLHEMLKSMFIEVFPDDVAERARSRLFVSITRATELSRKLCEMSQLEKAPTVPFSLLKERIYAKWDLKYGIPQIL